MAYQGRRHKGVFCVSFNIGSCNSKLSSRCMHFFLSLFSLNKFNSKRQLILSWEPFIDQMQQWLLSISLILPHQPSHVPGQSLFFSSHLLLVALFFFSFFWMYDVLVIHDLMQDPSFFPFIFIWDTSVPSWNRAADRTFFPWFSKLMDIFFLFEMMLWIYFHCKIC